MNDFKYDSELFSCHYTLTRSPVQEDFPMHAHDRFEIYCFLGGSAEYLVEGTRYKLKPGDVMIMRPAETHRLICDGSVPYERFAINFSKEALSGIPGAEVLLEPFINRELGSRNRFSRKELPGNAQERLIASVCSEKRKLLGEELNVTVSLLSFLFELCSAYREQSKSAARSEVAGLRVLEYVNAHLYDDISLKKVSETFFLSATHINRLFKKLTGSTMWNYVKIKRLLRAREEIRSGICAVEAARNCGYDDYSAFYRAYCERFNKRPSEDR